MNTKPITILVTFAILTAGCDKPKDNSYQNAMNAATIGEEICGLDRS